MHVPLNDHPKAQGPDTSLIEPTWSDDEFLTDMGYADLQRERTETPRKATDSAGIPDGR